MAKTLAPIGIIFVLIMVALLVCLPRGDSLTVDFAGYYADNTAADLFAAEHNRMLQASMFAEVGTTYSHAETKHPGATACMEGGNVVQVYQNPFTNHCAEIYQVDENRFVVRIIAKIKGKFEEITAFTNDVEGLWEGQKS
jgi:hypothetical protein